MIYEMAANKEETSSSKERYLHSALYERTANNYQYQCGAEQNQNALLAMDAQPAPYAQRGKTDGQRKNAIL